MNAENQDVLLDLEGEEEEGEEEEDDDDGETVLELKQVIIPTYGTVPDQPNLHTPEWVPEVIPSDVKVQVDTGTGLN